MKEELKKTWTNGTRALPANKHPIILDKNLGLELDIYKNIGLKKIERKSGQNLPKISNFLKRFSFALGEIAREKKKITRKKEIGI